MVQCLTLAAHANGLCTGRVAYLDGVTRADLPDLLPLLGGPVPLDAARGVVTDSVFAFQSRLPGTEVPLDTLWKVELAPGVWGYPTGTPIELDPRDYRD